MLRSRELIRYGRWQRRLLYIVRLATVNTTHDVPLYHFHGCYALIIFRSHDVLAMFMHHMDTAVCSNLLHSTGRLSPRCIC